MNRYEAKDFVASYFIVLFNHLSHNFLPLIQKELCIFHPQAFLQGISVFLCQCIRLVRKFDTDAVGFPDIRE